KYNSFARLSSSSLARAAALQPSEIIAAIAIRAGARMTVMVHLEDPLGHQLPVSSYQLNCALRTARPASRRGANRTSKRETKNERSKLETENWKLETDVAESYRGSSESTSRKW